MLELPENLNQIHSIVKISVIRFTDFMKKNYVDFMPNSLSFLFCYGRSAKILLAEENLVIGTWHTGVGWSVATSTIEILPPSTPGH